MMQIRDALASDLNAIVDIYNDVLASSTAIFSETPVDVAERRTWWSARVSAGYPVLVAVDQQALVGFASFGDFRSWPGYRFTVEHSVHVRADYRGRGVGSALMVELLARARAAGKHMVVGGIDASNVASLGFHEKLGFQRSAELPQVGYKFGRFLDLVFVSKRLQAPVDRTGAGE